MAPDLFYVIYYLLCLLWIYKVQILASIFVSLTVFEYFYRAYRKKKIRDVKRILIEILAMIEKDNWEHEFLAEQIKLLSKNIDKKNEMLEEQIKISYKGILAKNDGEFFVLNHRLDATNKKIDQFEQDTTERVNDAFTKLKVLEEDTDWIRTIKKYKLVLAGLISGILGVNYYSKIAVWFKSLNIF